jgi:hypothetical protein
MIKEWTDQGYMATAKAGSSSALAKFLRQLPGLVALRGAVETVAALTALAPS